MDFSLNQEQQDMTQANPVGLKSMPPNISPLSLAFALAKPPSSPTAAWGTPKSITSNAISARAWSLGLRPSAVS